MKTSTRIVARGGWHLAIAGAVTFGFVSAVCSADPVSTTHPKPAAMIDVLKNALAQEKAFIRIHAAEALVEAGEGAWVVAALQGEADGAPPIVRVGIWRTLGLAQPDRRAEWVGRLRTVMLTAGNPDRIHAAESLAKLGASLESDRRAIAELAEISSKAHSCHAIWLLALAGDATAEGRLTGLLGSDDPIARLASGYILGRLPAIGDEARQKLFAAARTETADSPACGYLRAAAYLRAPDAETTREFKTRLTERLQNGTDSERYAAALAIGERGTAADLALLAPLLEQTGDARIGGAQGSLRILRRAR